MKSLTAQTAAPHSFHLGGETFFFFLWRYRLNPAWAILCWGFCIPHS